MGIDNILIYLAAPYSHPDAGIRNYRLSAAIRAGAALMAAGIPAFSPLAYSSALVPWAPVRWEAWMALDLRLLAACTHVLVLGLPGWERSRGVRAELAEARRLGIPAVVVEPAAAVAQALALVRRGRPPGQENSSGRQGEMMIVLVDSREKIPLDLAPHLPAGAEIRRAHLLTGDYSLAGKLDKVAIERKRAEELYCTVGRGRRRFLAEIDRMRAMQAAGGYAAIVIEGSLHQVLIPPAGGAVTASQVIGNLVSWSRRGIPVWFAGDRESAALLVARILVAEARREDGK